MPTYRTRVDAKGQITLPGDLVKRLGIRESAEVEFFLTMDGDVFFHAISGTARDWQGLFRSEVRSTPFSIRDMDETVAEGLIEDDERIHRQAVALPAPVKDRSAAE